MLSFGLTIIYIAILFFLHAVPIMADLCPYEVTSNWTRLCEPSEYPAGAILTKDIKGLRKTLFVIRYHAKNFL